MNDNPPDKMAKYDGVMVFYPRVDLFKPGDIVLTRNAESTKAKGNLQSQTIQRASGGNFSHVLICSESPQCVEAIGKGVVTTSLQRCFVHDLANVRVLRYPDQAIARKAAQLAQGEIGQEYSVRKAISSVLPSELIGKILIKGTFCSALVAQVFVLAKAKEFSVTAVEKTTPATIEKMDILENVTLAVFQEILAPKNIENLSPLDGDRITSPTDKQTEITRKYAKELAPIAERVIEQLPQAGLSVPETFYKTLPFLMRAIEHLDMLDKALRDEAALIVNEFDSAAAELVNSGELDDVFNTLQVIEEKVLQVNLNESFNLDPNVDIEGTKRLLITSLEQIRKRTSAIDSFINWGLSRSKFIASWTAHQQRTLPPFERRVIVLREVLTRLGVRGIDDPLIK